MRPIMRPQPGRRFCGAWVHGSSRGRTPTTRPSTSAAVRDASRPFSSGTTPALSAAQYTERRRPRRARTRRADPSSWPAHRVPQPQRGQLRGPREVANMRRQLTTEAYSAHRPGTSLGPLVRYLAVGVDSGGGYLPHRPRVVPAGLESPHGQLQTNLGPIAAHRRIISPDQRDAVLLRGPSARPFPSEWTTPATGRVPSRRPPTVPTRSEHAGRVWTTRGRGDEGGTCWPGTRWECQVEVAPLCWLDLAPLVGAPGCWSLGATGGVSRSVVPAVGV